MNTKYSHMTLNRQPDSSILIKYTHWALFTGVLFRDTISVFFIAERRVASPYLLYLNDSFGR